MNMMKQFSDKYLSFKRHILADNLDMYILYLHSRSMPNILRHFSEKNTYTCKYIFVHNLKGFFEKKGAMIGNRYIEKEGLE